MQALATKFKQVSYLWDDAQAQSMAGDETHQLWWW
jgi:hypothetical protein